MGGLTNLVIDLRYYNSLTPQEHYMVQGAMQHPGGNGGIRVLIAKVGATHGSIFACFLNDFTMQVTGAYTYVMQCSSFLCYPSSNLLSLNAGYAV